MVVCGATSGPKTSNGNSLLIHEAIFDYWLLYGQQKELLDVLNLVETGD